jgi:hypothetical protein
MYEDTKSYFEKEGKLMFGGINGWGYFKEV